MALEAIAQEVLLGLHWHSRGDDPYHLLHFPGD